VNYNEIYLGEKVRHSTDISASNGQKNKNTSAQPENTILKKKRCKLTN